MMTWMKFFQKLGALTYAFSITLGLFSISDIAHSVVVDDVLLPAMKMS